ncbi:MAG: tetratricopeptide repeat protein [Acidobacteria bacterium]|nr:tetratricopeptide repeat protein [Acidobacteriota bacterium]
MTWTGRNAILLLVTAAVAMDAASPARVDQSWKDAVAKSERLKVEGRIQEAEQELRSVLEQTGANPLTAAAQARLHHDLGSLSQDRHRQQEAMLHYRRAIAAWEQAGPSYQLHLASTINNLACLLWEQGRLSEASRTLQRSVAIQLAANVPNPELPRILYNFGSVHLALGEQQEGRAILEQLTALPGPHWLKGDSLLSMAAGRFALSRLLRSQGQVVEAETHRKQALTLWAEWLASGRADFDLGPMTDVALALSTSQAPAEALAAAGVLLSWIDQQGPAAGLRAVSAMRATAAILRQAHRKSEARLLERRAKAILAANQDQLALHRHQVDVQTLRSPKSRW